MANWKAVVTNDPENNYELYIELLEDDEEKARIERAAIGDLNLRFYHNDTDVSIPLAWLLTILNEAERDLCMRK